MNQYPAAGLASLVAAQGQGPDTTLVHMTEDEVRALQDMARAQGRELPLNPITGLPQAGFLSDFLRSVGRGISTVARTAVQNPQTTALLAGTVYGAVKGDLQKGLEAGMKAYAGTKLLGGITSAMSAPAARGAAPTTTAPTARPSSVLDTLDEGVSGAATAPARPATGIPRTTTQQPGGLDALLRNVLGGGQPGTTQQGQPSRGLFGAGGDPIMEFIKLYALNKASQKMGQDKYMPKQEPVQYRNVQFNRGQVNPRFGEPGEPYFIGGGYTDYGVTTQYPGYTQTPTGPQQGQAQGPPRPPIRDSEQELRNYLYGKQAGMAEGGMVPAPNGSFPLARVNGNTYEPSVDPYTGEEVFAEGGIADTEEARRRDYFENLRPFAPALTDYYRGTSSTGRESVQGVENLRETDPLTGLTTGAPTGIANRGLADWYKSLLNPPIGRAAVDMGDYFKTSPFRAQTDYGQVVKYPEDTKSQTKTCPDGSVIPIEQECKTGGAKTKCPAGTKNAGMEYDPLDFLTGTDPCGGFVGECGENEFRNPASGECECNAGYERGTGGKCVGKGGGSGAGECTDPNAARNAAGECVCKEGYELGADGACKGVGTGTGGGGEGGGGGGAGGGTGGGGTGGGGTGGGEGGGGTGGGGAGGGGEGSGTGGAGGGTGGTGGGTGGTGGGTGGTSGGGTGGGGAGGAGGGTGGTGGGKTVVTPDDCLKEGLIYNADLALAGLYPCVSKTEKKECPPNSSRYPNEPEGPCYCNDNTTAAGGVAPEEGCVIKERTERECNPKTEYKDENGECQYRCVDGSIPGPDGCSKVGEDFCKRYPGTVYFPELDIGIPGMNPCKQVYTCDDGRTVLDPTDCDKRKTEDEECEWVGSSRGEDGICRCNSGRIPDPQYGCTPKCDDGLFPQEHPDGKCPTGEPGGGGEGGGGKGGGGKGGGEGEDGGGGGGAKEEPKCDPDEVQVGEVCYGKCPDGVVYTRGVGGDKPCATEEKKPDEKKPDDKKPEDDPYNPGNPNNPFKALFKQCPDGSYTFVWENCGGIPDVAAFNKFVNTKGFSIGGQYVDGATALLAAYETYKNISKGKEGAAAASAYALAGSLAKFGATAGYSQLAALGPYGVVFAAVAALGASLVNTSEMGDKALKNYWAGVDRGRGLGQSDPNELAQGFINFYRTNKNNFGGQATYGRTGNEDFVYDMTQLINQAVDAGYIKPGATADQIYANVVKPWLSSMSSGPDNDAARTVQDFMMTDLIYNYMLGRPISNAQVKGDSKYKTVSQRLAYNGVVPDDMKDLVGTEYTPPTGGGGRPNEFENQMKKASGGIVGVRRKKTKKYQTGGIAALNRTRMGAAVNPADGYNFGFAKGGLPSLPEYRAGGKLLRGPGDGMSDDIPAVIRGKGVQRAALADGEFVIPADVVSHLGNGSTEAGAKKLYKMMAQIRAARTGRKKQAPQVNADKYLPRA